MKFSVIALLGTLSITAPVYAADPAPTPIPTSTAPATPTREAIWDSQNKTWLTPQQAVQTILQGTYVVFGEEHVTEQNQNDKESILHHANQLRWLRWMKIQALLFEPQQDRAAASRLGMEFLEYPYQADTDDYLANRISEQEFKTKVRWGGNPFTPYNELLRESALSGGTRALNIPREISRKVAKLGPQSLEQKDTALLPPIWERGGPEYFARFKDSMGGHGTPEQIENYFWAQSLWDSTMAWKATQPSLEDPASHNDITTIIVGQFHAEFGHGLPFQLGRYGVGKSQIKTLIQVAVKDWQDVPQAIQPDSQYGERADLIWVYLVD